MQPFEGQFFPSYPDGYKNLPDKSTPVTAEILNKHENSIENIEDYLVDFTEGLPIAEGHLIDLLYFITAVPNPDLEGDEEILTGIEVGGMKYRIPNYDDTEIREEISDVKENIETTHTTSDKTITDASNGNIVALSLVGATTQGANPSPSNLQPINGFDGSMGTSGKNKLNLSQAKTQVVDGVTYTFEFSNNGELLYVDVNGSPTTDYSICRLQVQQIGKLPYGNYILTGCPQGGSTNTFMHRFYSSQTEYKNDVGNGVDLQLSESTYTATINGYWIVVMKGYTANHLKFYPMIRPATETDATYEPHQSSEIHTFPLYSIGDIKDELKVFADGSGELIKRIGKKILDGSEAWAYDSASLRFRCNISDMKAFSIRTKGFTNLYSFSESGNPSNGYFLGNTSGVAQIFVYDNRYTSVDDLKAFLSQTNLVAIYELNTPTTTKLTPSEVAEILKLKTYQGKTYIDAENVDFDLEYFADTEIGKTIADIKSTFLNLLLQPTPTNSEQE